VLTFKVIFQDREDGEKEGTIQIADWLDDSTLIKQVCSQLTHKFYELRMMRGSVVFHDATNIRRGGVVYFGPANLRVFLQGENNER